MDVRRIAQRRSPSPVFNYLDGGADDEWTLRRNTTALDDYELHQAPSLARTGQKKRAFCDRFSSETWL